MGIFDKTGGGVTNKHYQLFFEDSHLKFRSFKTSMNDLKVDTTTAGMANDGNWYHIVGTHSATRKKLYVNGVEKGSATGHSLPASTVIGDIRIGMLGSNVYGYKGWIDELTLWKAELTDAEVQTIYNTQKPD